MKIELHGLFLLYSIIISGSFIVTLILAFPYFIPTPKELYERNKLNVFGNIVLLVFYLLFNPLGYLARFLRWIFHVGRKD